MQLVISSEHVPLNTSLLTLEYKCEAEMFVELYEEYSFHLSNVVTSRLEYNTDTFSANTNLTFHQVITQTW